MISQIGYNSKMAIIVECRRHCNWSKKNRIWLPNFYIFDGDKNRTQTGKIFPFAPECITYMYPTLGHALFFAKKERNAMKSLRKSSFHFWSANALIAFVTNVEYQDGKSPKEKLKGSLSWKNKNYFFSTFFSLNYCRH